MTTSIQVGLTIDLTCVDLLRAVKTGEASCTSRERRLAASQLEHTARQITLAAARLRHNPRRAKTLRKLQDAHPCDSKS